MENTAFSYADDSDPWYTRVPIRLVETATGQRLLERLYQENRREMAPGDSFWSAALRKLDIALDYDTALLAAAPRVGPLVFVSNHPFGVLDGIALCSLAQQVRPDFRVLTNAVLMRPPEIRDRVLPIDFSGGRTVQIANARSRREASAFLAGGGALVLFPSGVVSTSPDRWGSRPAVDPPWHPFAASMILRAQATVMPVFFPGQNSRLFQIASHISMTIRLALLCHEVRRRMGKPMPIHFGAPIPFADLAPFSDRQALIAELRRRSEALRDQPRPR